MMRKSDVGLNDNGKESKSAAVTCDSKVGFSVNRDKIEPELAFCALDKLSLAAKTLTDDTEHLEFVLRQLEDPQHFRPLKDLSPGHDREHYFNPKTGTWQERKFFTERVHHVLDRQNNRSAGGQVTAFGHSKNTRYTKKTAVTLLPTDGRIDFYMPRHGKPIGLLFDIKFCNLKDEKYIFPEMANTDQRWWLYHARKKELIQRAISLHKLREILKKSTKDNRILRPNELLIGLSMEALVGIFSLANERESRVHAVIMQQKIATTLKKSLPIFIVDKDGMRSYSARQQALDLHETEIMNNSLFQKITHENVSVLQGEFKKQFFRFEDLFKVDNGSTQQILSFLNLSELSNVTRSSKALRLFLHHSSRNLLWRNLAQVKMNTYILPGVDKHDIGLYMSLYSSRKEYRDALALTVFSKQNKENAYRVMQSNAFSQQLPLAERQLPQDSRSLATKIGHGVIGFFIGLVIGALATFCAMFLALMRIVCTLATCGLALGYFNISIFRSVLGVTLFPLYSLFTSIGFGAFYTFNNGLNHLTNFSIGVSRFHYELYHGQGEYDNSADPWALWDNNTDWRWRERIYPHNYPVQPMTNLLNVCEKYRPTTIAEDAAEVRTNKPAFFNKLYILEPAQAADEREPLNRFLNGPGSA